MLKIINWKGCYVLSFGLIDQIAEKWMKKYDIPQTAVERRKTRDATESHHITIINPNEMSQIHHDLTTIVECNELEILDIGFGKISKGSNNIWFVGIFCPQIDLIRANYGLPVSYLHITLGFESHDQHDVSKSIDTFTEINLAPIFAKTVIQSIVSNSFRLTNSTLIGELRDGLLQHWLKIFIRFSQQLLDDSLLNFHSKRLNFNNDQSTIINTLKEICHFLLQFEKNIFPELTPTNECQFQSCQGLIESIGFHLLDISPLIGMSILLNFSEKRNTLLQPSNHIESTSTQSVVLSSIVSRLPITLPRKSPPTSSTSSTGVRERQPNAQSQLPQEINVNSFPFSLKQKVLFQLNSRLWSSDMTQVSSSSAFLTHFSKKKPLIFGVQLPSLNRSPSVSSTGGFLNLFPLPRNFSWALPGRLAGSALPFSTSNSNSHSPLLSSSSSSSTALFPCLPPLAALGFRCIITIHESPLPTIFIQEAQELYEIECIHLPCEDRTPPTSQEMKEICWKIHSYLYASSIRGLNRGEGGKMQPESREKSVQRAGGKGGGGGGGGGGDRAGDGQERSPTGGAVLVHCQGGVGRTNTVLGSYLMFLSSLSPSSLYIDLTSLSSLPSPYFLQPLPIPFEEYSFQTPKNVNFTSTSSLSAASSSSPTFVGEGEDPTSRVPVSSSEIIDFLWNRRKLILSDSQIEFLEKWWELIVEQDTVGIHFLSSSLCSHIPSMPSIPSVSSSVYPSIPSIRVPTQSIVKKMERGGNMVSVSVEALLERREDSNSLESIPVIPVTSSSSSSSSSSSFSSSSMNSPSYPGPCPTPLPFPDLLLLVGLPASGKSTLSKYLMKYQELFSSQQSFHHSNHHPQQQTPNENSAKTTSTSRTFFIRMNKDEMRGKGEMESVLMQSAAIRAKKNKNVIQETSPQASSLSNPSESTILSSSSSSSSSSASSSTSSSSSSSTSSSFLPPHRMCVISDNCNLSISKRMEWMDSLHITSSSPSTREAWCVYLDTDISECKYRIQRRKNHPTIPPGPAGLRIIDSMNEQLEIPSKKEGFSKLYVCRNESDVWELILKIWKIPYFPFIEIERDSNEDFEWTLPYHTVFPFDTSSVSAFQSILSLNSSSHGSSSTSSFQNLHVKTIFSSSLQSTHDISSISHLLSRPIHSPPSSPFRNLESLSFHFPLNMLSLPPLTPSHLKFSISIFPRILSCSSLPVDSPLFIDSTSSSSSSSSSSHLTQSIFSSDCQDFLDRVLLTYHSLQDHLEEISPFTHSLSIDDYIHNILDKEDEEENLGLFLSIPHSSNEEVGSLPSVDFLPLSIHSSTHLLDLRFDPNSFSQAFAKTSSSPSIIPSLSSRHSNGLEKWIRSHEQDIRRIISFDLSTLPFLTSSGEIQPIGSDSFPSFTLFGKWITGPTPTSSLTSSSLHTKKKNQVSNAKPSPSSITSIPFTPYFLSCELMDRRTGRFLPRHLVKSIWNELGCDVSLPLRPIIHCVNSVSFPPPPPPPTNSDNYMQIINLLDLLPERVWWEDCLLHSPLGLDIEIAFNDQVISRMKYSTVGSFTISTATSGCHTPHPNKNEIKTTNQRTSRNKR